MLSLFFSRRFHVSFFKFWRLMVVDTERGARDKKKEGQCVPKHRSLAQSHP